MKKILHIILVLSFVLVFAVVLVGCAPKGDPKDVLNDYYNSLKSRNPEAAYNDLAEASKNNFKKTDFIKWQNIQVELEILKSVDIKENNKYKNKVLDGINYKNVVEFNITENEHSNYEDKDAPINYKRYVVNDNGEWKVYREKENVNNELADSMDDLAWMYIDGKGKEKDLNKAVSVLNEAIKINPNYTGCYYTLAYTYNNLERYDEAISTLNKYFQLTKNDKDKSKGYNILGLAYEGKKDYNNAKKYYNQAIELNPDNQYAKSNLAQLNEAINILAPTN